MSDIKEQLNFNILSAIGNTYTQSWVWHADIFIGSGSFRDLNRIIIDQLREVNV